MQTNCLWRPLHCCSAERGTQSSPVAEEGKAAQLQGEKTGIAVRVASAAAAVRTLVEQMPARVAAARQRSEDLSLIQKTRFSETGFVPRAFRQMRWEDKGVTLVLQHT